MLLWIKRLTYCNVVRRSHGRVGQRLALGPLIQTIMWSGVVADATSGQRGMCEPRHQPQLGPHLGSGNPPFGKQGSPASLKPAGRIFWLRQNSDKGLPMPCG